MLSAKLKKLREQTRSGFYHQFRTVEVDFQKIFQECESLSDYQAQSLAFCRLAAAEKPVIIPGERLQFTRTIGVCIPRVRGGYILENLSPDYGVLLKEGVKGRIAVAERELAKSDLSDEERDFLTAAVKALQAVLELSERYAQAAEAAGEKELADLMRRVPANPAATLHEAVQSIYFITAMLRLSAACHTGFGRADQYLLEFYRRDLASGKETEESARELLTEFFIMLSRDYDLYDGVQRGDNGQSMVLGGTLPDGSNGDNELTILLLDIAADLAMIEPKINLRMSENTTAEVLKSAARLSGCGLGFPQYCNDEVVIPGLVKFGYPLEKARDYVVAACWEFVVPGGRDVPNLFAMNLAKVADRAIREALKAGEDFNGVLKRLPVVMDEMFAEIKEKRTRYLEFTSNPLFSSFCTDSLETRRDLNISGGSHRNFGCHGCASSTAADSLAAVKKLVFEEKKIAPETMLEALEKNFEGFDDLRRMLRESEYHVGCGNEDADSLLKLVFDTFADTLEKSGEARYGARVRPGTGSAMYYVLMTQNPDDPQYLKATADGRKEGEYISSSLSPAPGVKASGMLSVLKSYSKIDYSRVCNGGPITMEVDPVYFQSDAALDKMASFLQAFHRSGCQQLQINTLDADVLRRAQKHPEEYRDLIVRVWGWSGYFVELEKVYQDQIIARQAFKG
ncbi:MAG: pyruvate formate-lyase [Lentisphaeria bacterium]|nr:pyruvate formate-lyase [Lentisphaeria bacterium]